MNRLPSFRSIEKFYVQSKHGLKMGDVTLIMGDELQLSNLPPCTVRRFYNCCLIGSRDQVERHLRKIGLNNLVKFERDDTSECEDIKNNENSNMGLKNAELKKAKK